MMQRQLIGYGIRHGDTENPGGLCGSHTVRRIFEGYRLMRRNVESLEKAL